MFLRGPWCGERRVSVPGGWPGTAGLQMEKWGRGPEDAGGLYRQKRAGRESPPEPPQSGSPGGPVQTLASGITR